MHWRRLLLLPLLALPVFSEPGMIVLSVDKEITVAQFLGTMARQCGCIVLCDAKLGLDTQKMGAGFKAKIARHKFEETCRAILAFYELDLIDAGGNLRLVGKSVSTTCWQHCDDPVRVKTRVLGMGVRLDLDLARRADRTGSVTLPPRTRDRLLLALRYGLHPQGRATAAHLLGAAGPHFKSTADALARALDDDAPSVRIAAVQALGEMGSVAHHLRHRLRKMLDDKALQTAAERALQLTKTADD